MRRALPAATGAALIAIAAWKYPASVAGQGAVSMSKPGHEDLTFWVNHRGLDQFDFEGEVGFGDMARMLLRRRANSALMTPLRDRFTFKTREMKALAMPDVALAVIAGGKIAITHAPAFAVSSAGRAHSIPVIVDNQDSTEAAVEAEYAGASMASKAEMRVPGKSSAGLFLRAVETTTGAARGVLKMTSGGSIVNAALEFDVRPLVRVKVKIRDEKGAPAAARVYVTGSDGLAYTPRGSATRITAMSAEYYFHAEDAFDIDLPAGEAAIEAVRGQLFEPAIARVALSKPAEITLKLKPWENLTAKGWYSADAHIHANYTAPHHQTIQPEDVRLQTLAEDLNIPNLMVANSGGAFVHDRQYFEGKPHRLSRPNYILWWNEEMRNSGIYGHMVFFGLKKLVDPIYSGFRGTPNFEDYPANYNQAAEAQLQGGAVSYAHPGYGANFEQASMREMPVDLALGAIDAMDVLSNNFEPDAMAMWYRLLNSGFRVAISAGTDAFTNVTDHYTMGGGRVYAEAGKTVDGMLNYGAWMRAYKRGRSFASNGPVLTLSVDGRTPGDEIAAAKGVRKIVRVRVSAKSYLPIDKLEVVVNGRVAIASDPAKAIDQEIALEASSWIAARDSGPYHRLVLNDANVWAHTSPVYVSFGGEPARVEEDIRFYIDWIDKLIVRTRDRGTFATDAHRQEVLALFGKARAEWVRRAAARP